MTALSSFDYPHWLMIAGVLLLMVGFVGLALRQRGVEDEPVATANDPGPSEPEADLNEVEVYNRTAKENGRTGGLKVLPTRTRSMPSRNFRAQNESVLIYVDTSRQLATPTFAMADAAEARLAEK